MQYRPAQIITRIEWCRLQQNLRSLTQEEREGWRAEEAGLADALLGRERTEFARSQPGLQDSRILFRVTRHGPLNDQTDGGARQALSRNRPMKPTGHSRMRECDPIELFV